MPRPRDLLVGLVVLASIAGGARAVIFSGSKASASGDAAASPTEESPAGTGVGRASNEFEVARGLSRLEPLVREMRAQAEGYGVEVSIRDLQAPFEKAAAPLHPAVARREAYEMGLPPPERREFSAEDERVVREHGGTVTVKCLNGHHWIYLERLPGHDNGLSECWRRMSGTWTEDSGSGWAVTYVNNWIDAWERYTWQPNLRRWAPFSETIERRIQEHLVDTRYGYEAELMDRERSREALDRALAAPARNDAARGTGIKMAIVQAYETRAAREGARYWLEYAGKF